MWNGSAWVPVGVPQDVSDAVFSLVNIADPTKKALFSLSGISVGTTRSFTLPNASRELAILAGTQTFTGNKTFSGTLTASGATATIGTATGIATYGVGTGATASGSTKPVNLGTGGASGSNTVVNIGSATAGAGGTTVVDTPNVAFANSVTEVAMPQANLTAQLLGLGGATADSFNRLSVQGNGRRDIGYHHLIGRGGEHATGRPETTIGAHVIGHNASTIGICLVGGHGDSAQDRFADHFTPAQERALIALIAEIEGRTAIERITGHNQYAAKACPGFHVPSWLAAPGGPDPWTNFWRRSRRICPS